MIKFSEGIKNQSPKLFMHKFFELEVRDLFTSSYPTIHANTFDNKSKNTNYELEEDDTNTRINWQISNSVAVG